MTEFHGQSLASYFLPSDIIAKLGLDGITFLNKEKQLLIRQTLGIPKDQKFLDKLMQIPYKESADSVFLFHTEFQTVADREFTERMADYMLLRAASDKSECYTLAIISYARRTYSNKYVLGEENNGITIRFVEHIIHDQPEHLYQKPNCLISQLLYAIWIYEHRKVFSRRQMKEKFLTILKNIISFGFSRDSYLSLVLFVQKYALECLSDRRIFNSFVKQLNHLNPNLNTMTIMQQIREEGIEKGIEKGKLEEREILTTEFIKTLIKSTSFNEREIAKMTNATAEKVKAIKVLLQEG